MPYNGVGVFTRVYQWVQDAANGIFVDATRTDTDSNDIAAGLTNCVTRDGQSPWTANIPAGGFKITSLASGSAVSDSVNYGQVFNNPAFNSMSATGTVNFAGATTVTVPTVAFGDSSTNAASTAFVAATAFSAALPNQAGNAGKIVTTNGTTASWTDTINIPFSFGTSGTVAFGTRVDEAKGANIASAPTINLSTSTGNLIHITGVTTITAITIPSGAERTLVFDGILTLTHNATTLILPTGANITTAVNDTCKVRGDGSGNARVVSYERADGTALTATRYGVGLPTVLTPSVAANLDSLSFVVAGANGYFIELEGIRPNTGSGALQIQAANSGVVDTGSNYQLTATSTAATTTEWTSSGTTDAAGKGISGILHLTNANAATPVKGLAVNTISTNSGGGSSFATISSGTYLGGAISGLRFKWAGGLSFAATGNIRIYPIFNS